MESNTRALKDVIHITEKLCALLPEHVERSIVRYNQEHEAVTLLDLASDDQLQIRSSLSGFGLSANAGIELSKLIEDKLGDFRAQTQEAWRKIQESQLSFRSTSLERVKSILCRLFAHYREELLKIVRKEVSCKVKAFKDASDYGSSGEGGSDSEVLHRGHSKLAISILEKAYSMATNITQAERNKLAEATKLSRKQVTIWYQNRRNRKPVGRAKQPAPALSEPILSLESFSRKRKNDGLYGDCPRTPSQKRRVPGEYHTPSTNTTLSSVDTPSAFSMSSSVDTANSSLFDSAVNSRLFSDVSGASSEGSTHEAANPKFDNPSASSIAIESGDRYTLEERQKSCYIFDENGDVQLDFDDLELDLSALQSEMMLRQMSFDMPTPSLESVNSLEGIDFDLATSSRSPTANASTPSLEAFAARLGEQLREQDVTSTGLLQETYTQENWNTVWDTLIHRGDEAEEDSISLSGLIAASSRGKSTPASVCMEIATPDECAPSNPFDFSLAGLGIDTIVEQNCASFAGKDLFAAMRGDNPVLFQAAQDGCAKTFNDLHSSPLPS